MTPERAKIALTPSLKREPVPGTVRTDKIPPQPARAFLTGSPCPVCGRPVTGRRLVACSGRCRAALSRKRRDADRDEAIRLLQAALRLLRADDPGKAPNLRPEPGHSGAT
jgi:predicted nucleic acid-binding Zn ribbon protein